MPRINRLAGDLCNQIAAGEVVERPASVVKELVENAIDAEASRIQVDVGAGGVSLVRVTDDGTGMDERDARLAIERHATSKIGRIDDLLSLQTFGFRGEALPSIASVSTFILRTRCHDADEGVELRVNEAGETHVAPCGIAPGTIVEVQELFGNVPARRKFLKSTAAEAAAITNVLESLCLCAPSITLVLTRDGRKVRQWLRAASRKERALSAKPDDGLVEITGQRGPLGVQAYLGPPEKARAGATSLSLLVNGRVVRDRALTRVIAHAYGSVLEAGRYPVGVIYLDIEPRLVDLNVHPQKAEVRFADGRAVQNAVFRIVSEGVANAFGFSPPADVQSQRFFCPPTTPPSPHTPFSAGEGPDPWGLAPTPTEPAITQGSLPLSPSREMDQHYVEQGPLRYASLRFVAQLRGTYLVCESPDGIVIIDQHAAAERVTFARFRSAYDARSVSSQRLLVPVTVTINAAEAAFIEEASDLIEATGLEIRVMGPCTAVVSAIPQILSRASPERLSQDLLDEARHEGGRSFSGAIDRALATMACHGSLRAGESVSREQAHSLLEALDDVDHAGHCPHGRPLLMHIPFSTLDRQVGRR